MAANNLPARVLKDQVKLLQARRRRTKDAELQASKSRTEVWHKLESEIKASSGKATAVAEKRAAKAAKTAIAELTKVTGLDKMLEKTKKPQDSANMAEKQAEEETKQAGTKFRQEKQDQQKILDKTTDKKQRAVLKKEMKKTEKRSIKDIQEKMERRRRVPKHPYPQKEPEMLTLDKVRANLAQNEEYTTAQSEIDKSVKHSKTIYPLAKTRRRAYVDRRRRLVPSDEVATTHEISDMAKQTEVLKTRWEKAKADADAINPDADKSKKMASAAEASKSPRI